MPAIVPAPDDDRSALAAELLQYAASHEGGRVEVQTHGPGFVLEVDDQTFADWRQARQGGGSAVAAPAGGDGENDGGDGDGDGGDGDGAASAENDGDAPAGNDGETNDGGGDVAASADNGTRTKRNRGATQ